MKLRIGIIGDYDPAFVPHRATDTALSHAASALSLAVERTWLPTVSLDAPEAGESLTSFHGLWVAPGSPYKSMTGAMNAIRYARECGVPLLGTCGGFQHVILEYARNVLGFADASHAEYDPDASRLFIARLSCSLLGRSLEISLRPESLVAHTYGKTFVKEQYYCNFGVNPACENLIGAADLAVVGSDNEGEVRVVELRGHPFYVATLFVPQLCSSEAAAHPLVMGLINAARRLAGAQPPGSRNWHLHPTIREENPADIPEIRTLVQAAFGGPAEADLVEALRQAGKLTCSVVAEHRGRIVGHAAFSPVTIHSSDTIFPALALAPVAVAPDHQRHGLGAAMIRCGLERCRKAEHEIVIVLGAPEYYGRFGFTTASRYHIDCPYPGLSEAFMALKLTPGDRVVQHGTVRYGPEFDSFGAGA
jgi:predicted N-acetyltransferase YhbS